MDVGTLTGGIELDDTLSSTLNLVSNKVRKFADDLDGSLLGVSLAAGVVVTAVATAIGSIIGLAAKGDVLNGVESAFNRLSEAAGSTGDVLFERLNKGVEGTVDSLDLMQAVMRPLTAGVKLSGDDMEIMGQAARAMGKATGTDATRGLQTLSSALTTGMTRTLAMSGIMVDLSNADEKYAASLGITTAQLSAAGKLEAKRIAILDATRAYVDRLGVSQLTLTERLKQASVAIGNWFDDLSKAVAKSPNVSKAFTAIWDSIKESFGGSGATVLDTVVGWINKFADGVATYGPPIIRMFGNIKDGIVLIWETVQKAWNLVPDWFKNIAKEAALAGGAVGLVGIAFSALSGGGGLLTTAASVGTITSAFISLGAVVSGSTLLWPLRLLIDQIRIFGITTGITTTAQFLLHKSLTTTIGLFGWVAVAIGAIWIAWKVGHWESVSDWFMDIGLRIQGYSGAEREAMIATDKATQASIRQGKSLADQRTELEKLMRSSSGSGPSAAVEPPSMVKLDAEEYDKKLQALVESVRQANIGLNLHADALDKTDKKYRLTKESLDIFIPVIERKIGLNRVLTSTEVEVFTQAGKSKQADIDAGTAKMKLAGYTLDYIKQLKDQGLSEAAILLSMGVSSAAFAARNAVMSAAATMLTSLNQLESQLMDTLTVQAQKTRDLAYEEGARNLSSLLSVSERKIAIETLEVIRAGNAIKEMTDLKTIGEIAAGKEKREADLMTTTLANMLKRNELATAAGRELEFSIIAIEEYIVKQQESVEKANAVGLATGQWPISIDDATRALDAQLIKLGSVKQAVSGIGQSWMDINQIVVASAASLQQMFGVFNATTNLLGFDTSPLAPLGMEATGGYIDAGVPKIVGERGPETFIPSNSGTIIPAGGGSRGRSIVINAQGAFFGASKQQVTRTIEDMLAESASARSKYSRKQ